MNEAAEEVVNQDADKNGNADKDDAPKKQAVESAAEAKPAPLPVAAVAVEATPEAAEAMVAAVATPRPAWVDAAPGLSGGVYAISVPSGRYVSVPECQRALDEVMQQSVDYYINQYLGDDQAAELVGLSLGYIKQNLKHDEFAEIVHSRSVGPMHQLHARLEFDDKARADFQRLWRNAVVQHRLLYTGGGAVLVLALLGTLYGYLKLDLKTGGAHKGRLQLAATLVALIVAAGVLIARRAVHF